MLFLAASRRFSARCMRDRPAAEAAAATSEMIDALVRTSMDLQPLSQSLISVGHMQLRSTTTRCLQFSCLRGSFDQCVYVTSVRDSKRHHAFLLRAMHASKYATKCTACRVERPSLEAARVCRHAVHGARRRFAHPMNIHEVTISLQSTIATLTSGIL